MSNFSLDHFLDACGATGPLRLTVGHGGAADDYVLPQPFALAGGDPRADLRAAGARLPRRAAFVQVIGGRLLCLDLSADSGRKGDYPPHHWLSAGEAWACRGITVRLAADRSGLPDRGRTIRREDLSPIGLDIAGAAHGPCRYDVKAPIVLIGKSPQCQVRLRDAAVSRFHCALVYTPAGLWVVDLLGRGGIAVNGTVARAARLDDGDELRIGGFTLRRVARMAERRPHEHVDGSSPSSSRLGAESLAPLPRPPGGGDWLPAVTAGQQDAMLAPLVTLIGMMQQQMAEQFRVTMTGMLDTFRKMQADQMQMVWTELAQIRRLNEEVTSLKSSMARLPAAPPKPAAEPPRPPQPAANPIPVPRPPAPAPARKPETVPPQPAAPAGQDVHTWLSQRVAGLEKEREGRWQKLVNFLTGSTS
jgi:hypothetical protein